MLSEPTLMNVPKIALQEREPQMNRLERLDPHLRREIHNALMSYHQNTEKPVTLPRLRFLEAAAREDRANE